MVASITVGLSSTSVSAATVSSGTCTTEVDNATGNWQEMGPTYWNRTSGWNPGVGRITSIAVDENNYNHMIVGANTGGVWRTINKGQTWTSLTDNFSAMLNINI